MNQALALLPLRQVPAQLLQLIPTPGLLAHALIPESTATGTTTLTPIPNPTGCTQHWPLSQTQTAESRHPDPMQGSISWVNMPYTRLCCCNLNAVCAEWSNKTCWHGTRLEIVCEKQGHPNMMQGGSNGDPNEGSCPTEGHTAEVSKRSQLHSKLMASACLSVKHSSKLQVLTNIKLGLK